MSSMSEDTTMRHKLDDDALEQLTDQQVLAHALARLISHHVNEDDKEYQLTYYEARKLIIALNEIIRNERQHP